MHSIYIYVCVCDICNVCQITCLCVGVRSNFELAKKKLLPLATKLGNTKNTKKGAKIDPCVTSLYHRILACKYA